MMFSFRHSKLENFHEMIENLTLDIRNNIGLHEPINSMKELENIVEKIGGKVIYVKKNMSGYTIRQGDKFILYLEKVDTLGTLNQMYLRNKIYDGIKNLGRAYLIMRFGLDNDFFMSFKENELVDGIYEESNGVLLYDESLDYFAKSFLMPKSEFIELSKTYKQGGKINTYALAKYFSVTLIHVASRGNDLGIML